MKQRIFVDTNVLLDVLLEREGFYYDALKIWANAELGKVEACIAAISLNNVHYVMRRLKSETTAMIAVKIRLTSTTRISKTTYSFSARSGRSARSFSRAIRTTTIIP